MPTRKPVKYKKPPPPKDKGGRPSFKPTEMMRQQVVQFVATGVNQEDIARALVPGGISIPTLHKYFREELDTGAIKANAVVGGAIFNAARGGNMQAAIWWTKSRMGWKDTTVQELVGKDGGPIATVDETVDPAAIIRDRLAALAAAHKPEGEKPE